jgi:cytochrome oxidase Cu insertion factor (SCO1/SenC/PrrC family)
MAAHDPALHGKLRLVSMSFDPDSDTPATMRSYGGSDIDPAAPAPWHFLTTASRSDLAPLLAGFGQDVTFANPAVPGQRSPIASHLLKVYLLDRTGTVREIYSTAFLHPLVLRNDVLTLLDEHG